MIIFNRFVAYFIFSSNHFDYPKRLSRSLSPHYFLVIHVLTITLNVVYYLNQQVLLQFFKIYPIEKSKPSCWPIANITMLIAGI